MVYVQKIWPDHSTIEECCGWAARGVEGGWDVRDAMLAI